MYSFNLQAEQMPGLRPRRVGAGTRDDAPIYVAFRDSDHVGTRDLLAMRSPYRRFADTLANANAPEC